MLSRRTPIVALAAVATLALAACGGDDDKSVGSGALSGASDDGGGALTVVAEDVSFPSDTYEAKAGAIDVVYENEGSIEHTLVIEDVDGFKLTVTAKGDVDEGTVELDAGSYAIYCDVPGHREAGMEAVLEVS